MALRNPLFTHHVRLRRLAGDPRIHITDSGHTQSGHPIEASTELGSEATYLRLELDDRPYRYADEGDTNKVEIRADRILLADVNELRKQASPNELAWRQLLDRLDSLRGWMSNAEPPPCGHEDVIETPELGQVQARGICVWCPAPLVRVNDEWIPA